MRGVGVAAAAAAMGLFAGKVLADVDPIVISGSKFFYKTNGTQFFIRGVAYQQDYSGNGTSTGTNATVDYKDPLGPDGDCTRDIPYLTQLSTNTIRVYAINPDQDHDACMTALANAGIYVVADLSAPLDGESINRDNPAWNDELYARYTSVVDTMSRYSNLLGFFAGNEVSNSPNTTAAAAFVKAAVRDTKAYIKAKNYRDIGVGYATNDDASIRVNIADYFNCGNQSSAIDFWGYNIYSWCGNSSFTESGYSERVQEFESYSVPAFFAEYGCNTPSPREFTEVGTIFGDKMTPVFSGGIVYMYFEETNNFGLVTVDGDSVTPNQDFQNLKNQMASISPSGVLSASYTPTNSPQACPSNDGTSWAAAATPLPPPPNAVLCQCMYASLTCVVSSSTNETAYGDLFNYLYSQDDTSIYDGIAHNGSTGTYGDYSMCNNTEQLGFALNAYYQAQDSADKASACAFSGAASTQAAVSPTGTCAALVSQAGTAGTGAVTATANAGNLLSGSAASSAKSSGAGAIANVPGCQSGLFPMVFVITAAAISGMGMILL